MREIQSMLQCLSPFEHFSASAHRVCRSVREILCSPICVTALDKFYPTHPFGFLLGFNSLKQGKTL